MRDYDPIGEFKGATRGVLLAAGALMTALVLLACSNAKPIAYYASHPEERAARIEQCLASGTENPDCLNAKQAEFDARGIPAINGRAIDPAS